jgi:alpha-galactosidase
MMTQDRKKLVLIGAGSASFTMGLVADLILAKDLGAWELNLVDIDEHALDVACQLSQKMIEKKEADIQVRASTQRRDLLPSADLVVTTISVGGRRAWEADVFIPRKYNIFQPVGDTAMPGGISRALRMIPALVDIANDVKTLCPKALFINYSNPMTANCWAIRQATGVPVIGLCHGVFHVERELAAFIEAPIHEVTSLYAGLNHLTFIYDFRWRGEDAWPLVESMLAKKGDQGNPFSWSFFKAYGAYPAVNDRHVVEFFPERFPKGHYYGKQLGINAFSFEDTITYGDQGFAAMEAQAAGHAPVEEAIFERAEGEHEQLLDILRSIQTDQRKIFSVNLPNQGTIPGILPEAILEVPAVATATGLRPLQLHDVPQSLTAILNRKVASTSLTVEAALKGDRACFIEALLLDGAVTDTETAQQLSDELLAAQRQYLPNFY